MMLHFRYLNAFMNVQLIIKIDRKCGKAIALADVVDRFSSNAAIQNLLNNVFT